MRYWEPDATHKTQCCRREYTQCRVTSTSIYTHLIVQSCHQNFNSKCKTSWFSWFYMVQHGIEWLLHPHTPYPSTTRYTRTHQRFETYYIYVCLMSPYICNMYSHLPFDNMPRVVSHSSCCPQFIAHINFPRQNWTSVLYDSVRLGLASLCLRENMSKVSGKCFFLLSAGWSWPMRITVNTGFRH